MEDIIALVVFIVFIIGGSCSLAGTWWQKKKRHEDGRDMRLNDPKSL